MKLKAQFLINLSGLKMEDQPFLEFETWAASVLLETNKQLDIPPVLPGSWRCSWEHASCLGLLHWASVSDGNSCGAFWNPTPALPFAPPLHSQPCAFHKSLRALDMGEQLISQLKMSLGISYLKMTEWIKTEFSLWNPKISDGVAQMLPLLEAYVEMSGFCLLFGYFELWLSHLRDCFNVFL